jgi:predicted nucleic acid-binding protein
VKRYVLDANAVIINFEARTGFEKVRRVLEAAGQREAEVFMSVINIAEVFSALWKRHGETHARQAVHLIVGSPIIVVDASMAAAIEAAEVRAKFHTGMGDAFAAATALKKRATLVTSDSDFRRFYDHLKILWLPSHKSVN